jgi:hypothetical protein
MLSGSRALFRSYSSFCASFSLSAVVAVIAAASAQAQGTAQEAAQQPRAVVELFTSQGCSSCPPADRLLGELSKDSSLVVLSVPVDYWDYLGWKDTLAFSGNSNRQRAYARTRGDREVFTPQAVVNGVAFALGSDKSAIDRAIVKSGTTIAHVPVKLAVSAEKISVDVAGKSGGSGEVWLCPISSQVEVAIGRGENNGSRIVYHNVVRRWVKLGEWSGKPASFNVPRSEVMAEGADAVVVLVQGGSAGTPGAVSGAATAALR